MSSGRRLLVGGPWWRWRDAASGFHSEPQDIIGNFDAGSVGPGKNQILAATKLLRHILARVSLRYARWTIRAY